MLKIFCVFVALVSVTAFAAPRIEIDLDKDDCLNGSRSMKIRVNVDNESFDFDQTCVFSFNETFKTSTGIECEIDAGMCSAFSPKNKIEVSCGLARKSAKVRCPD